nr:VAN3-binding protein-like [Ipomoea batatas]
MEFLSRSWSSSALEISKAIGAFPSAVVKNFPGGPSRCPVLRPPRRDDFGGHRRRAGGKLPPFPATLFPLRVSSGHFQLIMERIMSQSYGLGGWFKETGRRRRKRRRGPQNAQATTPLFSCWCLRSAVAAIGLQRPLHHLLASKDEKQRKLTWLCSAVNVSISGGDVMTLTAAAAIGDLHWKIVSVILTDWMWCLEVLKISPPGPGATLWRAGRAFVTLLEDGVREWSSSKCRDQRGILAVQQLNSVRADSNQLSQHLKDVKNRDEEVA